MSNKDLVLAAAKIRNVTRCRNTMGERGVLGIRVQPNHPADDIGGILLSAFEGLLYGCGDAVIGVNPASDSVETVSAQSCARLIALWTPTKFPRRPAAWRISARNWRPWMRGAPVDLLFQSIAGTEAANRSFGITLAMLREGRERVLEHHRQRDVPWKGRTSCISRPARAARFPPRRITASTNSRWKRAPTAWRDVSIRFW